MSDTSKLTGPNGGKLVFDTASGAVVELLTTGGSFPTHPATDPAPFEPLQEIQRLRITTLEADLAASREREAALAAVLEYAHERIERVINSLHLNISTADYEAHLLRQIVDDVIGTRGQAILAAHDAEVRKPLEEKIAELAAACERLSEEYQRTLDALERDNIQPSADVRKYLGVEAAKATLAEVRREAKIEALQKVLGAANKEADRDPELRESYATMLMTAITDHLAALKAEKEG